MLERAPSILKLVCAGLAVLLLARTTLALRHLHPLKRTSVPEPPTWTAPNPTNPPAKPSLAGPPPGPAGPTGPGIPAPPGRPTPGRPPRGAGPSLPPDVEARIDKTVQSELLGPVMRPPPMALLGIAGQDVFFRAPNGQSGLVREGGELGGVQIVRVGTNRILVKEGTELKELVIFEGIGGESLMPKPKEGTP